MIYSVLYLGGPKNGEVEYRHSPPSQRVPVYAFADAELVCADEQVIDKLGHYERDEAGEGDDCKHYAYWWCPA